MRKLVNLYLFISATAKEAELDLNCTVGAKQFKSFSEEAQLELIELFVKHVAELELNIVQAMVNGRASPERVKTIQQAVKAINRKYLHVVKSL